MCVCLDTRDTRCSTWSFGSIYAVLSTVQHATSAMTATTIMTALVKANTMQADDFVAFHNFFILLFILFELFEWFSFHFRLGSCVCVCAVILCNFFLFSLVPTCKSLNWNIACDSPLCYNAMKPVHAYAIVAATPQHTFAKSNKIIKVVVL